MEESEALVFGTLFLLIAIAISIVVRGASALFSRRLRSSIALHPVAHLIWLGGSLLAALLLAAWIYPRVTNRAAHQTSQSLERMPDSASNLHPFVPAACPGQKPTFAAPETGPWRFKLSVSEALHGARYVRAGLDQFLSELIHHQRFENPFSKGLGYRGQPRETVSEVVSVTPR